MKPVILIGGGGHARSIVEMLQGSVVLAGYADREPSPLMPVPYLGSDADIMARYSPEDVDIHLAIGFGAGCSVLHRRQISDRYAAYTQATLTAPSAWISPSVEIGAGSTVMARTVVNRSRLGRNVVVNTAAVIEHDCRIADNSFVGPGAILCGEVELGEDVFIGAGAIVRQGLSICAGTVVGMGAVVIENIDEPGVYVGTPAVKIR